MLIFWFSYLLFAPDPLHLFNYTSRIAFNILCIVLFQYCCSKSLDIFKMKLKLNNYGIFIKKWYISMSFIQNEMHYSLEILSIFNKLYGLAIYLLYIYTPISLSCCWLYYLTMLLCIFHNLQPQHSMYFPIMQHSDITSKDSFFLS